MSDDNSAVLVVCFDVNETGRQGANEFAYGTGLHAYKAFFHNLGRIGADILGTAVGCHEGNGAVGLAGLEPHGPKVRGTGLAGSDVVRLLDSLDAMFCIKCNFHISLYGRSLCVKASC